MKKLHFWISIPSGILICLICLTGAVMVFQQELLEICYRDRYFVSQSVQEKMDMDVLVSQANQQLVCDTIGSVKIFSDPRRTIEASLRSQAKSYVYINPYTAQITGYYNARKGFFHKTMVLHRWLMLPNRPLGRLIVGISTICMIFILISGLVRWWKTQLFILKPKSNGFRRLLDLHRVLGFYSAIILIVCALSGLMWSFEWYRNGVASLTGIKKPHGQVKKESKTELAPSPLWEDSYRAFKRQNTDHQWVQISANGSLASLAANALHPRATDSYRYQTNQDTLSSKIAYGTEKNSSYMMGIAYVLHVGSWGGLWSKWLTFIAALVGASLPITGYVLYFRRKRKGRLFAKKKC